MKYRLSWFSPFVALIAMGMAGCSSSPIDRIDANRAMYETWPLEMQSAVLDGKVVKGMTPDMVRMALGKPTRIETRSGANASDEVWIYDKGDGTSRARPNVSMGGAIGGVGVSSGGRRRSGGSRTPSNAQEQQVVFQNGVVTRAD